MWGLQGIGFSTNSESDTLDAYTFVLNYIHDCIKSDILFHFTAAGCKCRVAAVKRLPVLHNSAVYFFTSFGIIKPILHCNYFQNRIPL